MAFPKHIFGTALFLLPLLGATLNAQQAISFQAQPPKNGTKIIVSTKHKVVKNKKIPDDIEAALGKGRLDIRTVINGNWQETIQNSNQSAVTQVTVSYKNMDISVRADTGEGVQNKEIQHAVKGKTYNISLNDEQDLAFKPKDASEKNVSQKEKDFLRKHFQFLGSPTPLQKSLNDQTLSPDQQISVPSSILNQISHGAIPSWPQGEEMKLTFKKKSQTQRQKTEAVLALKGNASYNRNQKSGTATVEGTLRIDPDSCQIYSANVKVRSKSKKKIQTKKKTITQQNIRTDKIKIKKTYKR